MVTGTAPHTASTSKRSFTCAHCGAFAGQTWLQTYAREFPLASNRLPPSQIGLQTAIVQMRASEDKVSADAATDMLQNGLPFLVGVNGTISNLHAIGNMPLSRCHACLRLSCWVGERLVWPVNASSAPKPSADIPKSLAGDFEEARSIVALSPRGAAALLRLCVQKLCKELGESGDDINADIRELVKKGLSAEVQQALDVLRVIGNESVHPGTMDLSDDVSTAMALFGLVNFIIEQRITQPKLLKQMYASLPQKKLEGIQQRDQPKA